jgi:predicted nucleotidyltransferase
MDKSTTSPTKEELCRRLAPLSADKSLRFIALFGSHAKGKGRAKSDIDVGFLFDFDAPPDLIELTNSVNRLLQMDNVDVVDLGKASPLLRYAAAQNGTLLYEREPGSFTRFFSLSYRMYVDTRKLREARDRRIEGFLTSRVPA